MLTLCSLEHWIWLSNLQGYWSMQYKDLVGLSSAHTSCLSSIYHLKFCPFSSHSASVKRSTSCPISQKCCPRIGLSVSHHMYCHVTINLRYFGKFIVSLLAQKVSWSHLVLKGLGAFRCSSTSCLQFSFILFPSCLSRYGVSW